MSENLFRNCKSSDLKQVALLVDELYASDPGEISASPDIALTYAEFERHPDKGTVIVFEQEGEIVGYAILVFFWSNEFKGDIIEIDELCVGKQHRNKGIGKAFFHWLENAYPDCPGFALQTSESNENARRLYERAGFTDSANQYKIKIRACAQAAN